MNTKPMTPWRDRIAFLLVGIVIGVAMLGWMIWNPFFGATSTPTPSPASIPTLNTTPTLAPTARPSTADELWQHANNCQCLTLYTSPEIGAPIILKAISSAQKSIRLKMYLFTRDDVQSALIAASQRGVDVRVLMELNPEGGQATNVAIFDAMKNTPVKFEWTSFDFRFTHEKSLVIDDKLAFIMTNNITSSSFDANREYAVIDTIPGDVAEVIQVYEADWQKVAPALANPRLVWSPINARAKLIGLIDSAQTSLDIEQEEWNAPEIIDHVLSAVKRGVVVRAIFSPHDPLASDTDEPQRDLIRRAGAQVKYMSSPYVHAKMFLVNGTRAFIGSENVSDNSLDNNRELGIIFDQPDAIADIKQTFEKDWAVATIDAFPVSSVPLPADGLVNWQDAAQYYNRTVTVQGQVVNTYNSGKVVFLDFSKSQSDLSIVIFPNDWNKFAQVPDKLFANQTIRVTGKVQEYNGAPEIIVTDPGQIVAVNDGSHVSVPSLTPFAPIATTPPSVVNWQDAVEYYGQAVTIEGKIVNTYNSGKVIYLDFSKSKNDLSIVIFPGDWSKFADAPDKLFANKTVRVTGKVQEYNGAPEIIVNDPSQIAVVSN